MINPVCTKYTRNRVAKRGAGKRGFSCILDINLKRERESWRRFESMYLLNLGVERFFSAFSLKIVHNSIHIIKKKQNGRKNLYWSTTELAAS